MTADPILDRIDAALAAGEKTEPEYPRCPHCRWRPWHGQPITARIEQMRRRHQLDPDYRYADDDSEILCPGSLFIGPMPNSVVLHTIPGAAYYVPQMFDDRPEAAMRVEHPDIADSISSLWAAVIRFPFAALGTIIGWWRR